ncbi:MAG: hypothetical protein MJ065_09025, partial [Oscillospiraceae bacterium]|nr:hypothetical protein [Oscillospiraceae bacterium]
DPEDGEKTDPEDGEKTDPEDGEKTDPEQPKHDYQIAEDGTAKRRIHVLLGDIDEDKAVTAKDAQFAISAYTLSIIGAQTGLTVYGSAAGDIDDDGNVTSADAQYILQYYTQNTISKTDTAWIDLLPAQ